MSNRFSAPISHNSLLPTLRRHRLCYLATPYSKFPGGMHEAYVAACQIAGFLIKDGVHIFCPIAHSHAVCDCAGLDPTSHAIWNEQNAPFMESCDAIIVAQLPSWEFSIGIEHEIKTFRGAGKPVYYVAVLHEDDRS